MELCTHLRNYPSEQGHIKNYIQVASVRWLILIRFLRIYTVQILCLPHNPSKTVILLNPSFRTPHWACPKEFPKINLCKGFLNVFWSLLTTFWMDWNFSWERAIIMKARKNYLILCSQHGISVTEAPFYWTCYWEFCKVLSFIWIFHCPNHFQSWRKVES